MKFCDATSLTTYPTTENALMLFVAYLHGEGLSPSTIKCYLAGVRHGQIKAGFGNPHIAQMPQLEYVLKGVKRLTKLGSRTRLPITPPILRELKRIWEKEAVNPDMKMLWAASCLCFFGFLRSGEVVTATVESYDPEVHLCYGDIRIDSHTSPSFLQVQIKASKTDPYRQGVTLYIGATGTDLCPVTAVVSYMMDRGTKPGPFFTRTDGRYLTREYFVSAVRTALTAAGLTAKNYAGHSFRIGAATTAAQQGLQDSLIKTLGRWQSIAYTRYIRTSRETLTKVAKALVSSKD